MNEVIVGVDGSETARRAAHKAAEVASARGVGLHLVTTVQRSSSTIRGSGETWHVDSLSAGEQLLKSLSLSLRADEITTSVMYGDPADAMCDEADRLDAVMIAVGNRRLQSAARVLGAVASQVTRRASCDVLVVNTTVDTAGE